MALSSTKLIRVTQNFNSPYSNYSTQMTKWMSNNSKTPHIESMTFTVNGNTNSTYSKRLMQNGDTFEVFQFNDQFLKVIKNKQGQFTAHKANFLIPLNNVARVYENSINLMRSRLNSLFTTPSYLQKNTTINH